MLLQEAEMIVWAIQIFFVVAFGTMKLMRSKTLV
jgi:hypothetical protein